MMKHVPNTLTMLRVLAAFLVPVFIVKENWPVAFVIAVLGFLTDLLDGAISRAYHVESNFGKVADPIADVVFDVGIIVGASIAGFIGLPMTLFLVVSGTLLRFPAFFTDTKSLLYRIGFLSGIPYVPLLVVFVVRPYLKATFGAHLFQVLLGIVPVIAIILWLKRERIMSDAGKLFRIAKS